MEGEVAEATKEIIRETCKELDIEIIDMAMNEDHVQLFIKSQTKASGVNSTKNGGHVYLNTRFP